MENYFHQIKNIALKSAKPKIAIIGKGASVKDVQVNNLHDFFVINLNDSEKVISGDVALLYRPDFFARIKANGFKANYYIAPDYLKIPDAKHIEVEYQPMRQDRFDQMFDYLQNDKFYLTDFTLLSAIKLSIIYQEYINTPVEVYFIGFDFFIETVNSDENDMHDLEYRNVFLLTQESYLKTILKDFNQFYPDISLFHVGEKKYSRLSVISFNNLISSDHPAKAAKYPRTNKEIYKDLLKQVYETEKSIVVAELTNNHIGSPERLVKMIELVKESGADMVKVQKRDVESFYTQSELAKPYHSPFGNTLRDYRAGVELSVEMFHLLDDTCRKLEIPWFASVLDWSSYEFMLQFDPILLKLPSTISNHKNYLLKVGTHFKGDLVISTGFTNAEYGQFVLENFVQNRNLFLLQCTSSYPTPPEACQVAVVRHYNELRHSKYPNLYSGYSSHDVGSLACMLAIGAGAKMLEKHVKLGNLEWVHFDGVAVDLYNNHFKNFVHDVRKAELICGSSQKKIHAVEHHKYLPNEINN